MRDHTDYTSPDISAIDRFIYDTPKEPIHINANAVAVGRCDLTPIEVKRRHIGLFELSYLLVGSIGHFLGELAQSAFCYICALLMIGGFCVFFRCVLLSCIRSVFLGGSVFLSELRTSIRLFGLVVLDNAHSYCDASNSKGHTGDGFECRASFIEACDKPVDEVWLTCAL